jgi:hypothetical protein
MVFKAIADKKLDCTLKLQNIVAKIKKFILKFFSIAYNYMKSSPLSFSFYSYIKLLINSEL